MDRGLLDRSRGYLANGTNGRIILRALVPFQRRSPLLHTRRHALQEDIAAKLTFDN